MTIIRSEKYIMVESDNNHNKCWYIEEYDNGLIKTIWGRVGNTLNTTEKQFSSASSTKEFDKMVKSKLKKGYTKLRTIDNVNSNIIANNVKHNIQDIALKEIDFDKTNSKISKMISAFCNANIHNITTNTSITFDKNINVF